MLINIKSLLLYVGRALGLFALGRFLTQRSIMIVGWHGVSRGDEHKCFPSLYISKNEFQRRLQFLTKHYQVVPLDGAVEQLNRGSIAARQVVLTFDDGNYDFYAEAAPILEQFGVTATNYVVTHFVDSGEPVWNMLVRYIICLARRAPDRNAVVEKFTTHDSKTLHSERYWLERLAALQSTDEKHNLVEHLAHHCQVDLSPINAQRLMHTMSPEEAKELSKRGFDIQMHTHEHKNAVDYRDELAFQIEECRRKLELWTGKSIAHFCYPSGRWDDRAVARLQDHAVRSAVTTRPGPNLRLTNPLSLRRVLNGEINSQIEFEFEMSNLRWLVKSAFNPRFRLNPKPQTQSYAEERAKRHDQRRSALGKQKAH